MGTRRRRKRRRSRAPVVTYVEGEALTLHKGTGQAYFYLPDGDGKKARFAMGRFYADPAARTLDTETLQRAADWIRAYHLRGAPPDDGAGITVAQLAERFLEYARGHYGEESSRLPHFEAALGFVTERYGETPASGFGPLRLLAVRDAMVESDRWNRKGVNQNLALIKRAFRWASSRELVDAAVHAALATVENIARGRTNARESRKVRPVPARHVEAVLAKVSRQVRAMIELQLVTGMRPGEVVQMRPRDIDRDGEVWTYTPEHHKTEHLDRDLAVPLGPRAQKILAPFLLGREADAFVFSPREAEEARLRRRHAARKTPARYGNTRGTNRRSSPRWQAGERYTTASYRRAIRRACDGVGVPRWTPHQLRHNRATEVRKRYGIEAARIALGHSDAGVTQLYAEMDRAVAIRVAKETG